MSLFKRFNEVFRYNPKTGRLYWKKKPHPCASNMAIGEEAGMLHVLGYRNVKLDRKRFKVHRVIWEMHNNEISDKMEIDHINHVRDDNRMENLRLITKKENLNNKAKYRNNKSGYPGVIWHNNRWEVTIGGNGRGRYVGRYNIYQDAVNARKIAEIKHGYHENHGE